MKKFISHHEYGSLYKTGDICKWSVTGRFRVFFGRQDGQVKIFGHRV